jgi:hypothetical protein
MKKRNKQKKIRKLYNALVKLGCCGYCANRDDNNDRQLYLFCRKNKDKVQINNYIL